MSAIESRRLPRSYKEHLASAPISRRKVVGLGAAAGLAGVSGAIGGITGLTIGEFKSHKRPHPFRNEPEKTINTQIDSQIPNVVHDLTQHGWDTEIDATAQKSYLDMFPDGELTYELEDEHGDTIARVEFTDEGTTITGNVRQEKDDLKNPTLQMYSFPEENTTLHFTESVNGKNIYEDEFLLDTTWYADSSLEDDGTQPRVISELDLAAIDPERNIYQEITALLERFDPLLSMNVVLFDSSDNALPLFNASDYIDLKNQRLHLPAQYFTDPKYTNQGEIILFHLLSLVVCTETSNNRNPSLLQKTTGELEEALRHPSPEGYKPSFIDELPDNPLEVNWYLEDRQYDPALLYYPTTPVYIQRVTHAMTIFGNFSDEFMDQFYITDREDPQYCNPKLQRELLGVSQHIFDVFKALGSHDALRTIIPDYDKIEDFIHSYIPPQE